MLPTAILRWVTYIPAYCYDKFIVKCITELGKKYDLNLVGGDIEYTGNLKLYSPTHSHKLLKRISIILNKTKSHLR